MKEGLSVTLQNFYRDTWAEINLDAIFENAANMKNHLPSEITLFAVVKANAYGHGDVEVAETAIQAGASYLAVAFLDEALALRKKGITAPILVLGASRPEDAQIAARESITLTVFQAGWLEAAQSFLEGTVLTIHLKCDSGMGRIGIRKQEEMNEIERFLQKTKCFVLEGIFTHFATADQLDTEYFSKQLARFEEMLTWLKEKPKYVHAANSAALLRFPNAVFNSVRMGISLYGLSPSMEMKEVLPFALRPAFSLKTKLVHVKNISKGQSVSYGATYTAEEDTWIGTLPIGYADGWIRMLQGQEVLLEGGRSPLVGRICMDQCMVKLSREFPVGTEVTLIGKNGTECITVDDIAEKLNTINYEVTCMISSRVPRMYLKDGRITGVVNQLI